MGAVFFFIFLGILFFIAAFFIILSVILLIIRKIKIHKGNTVKKRWLVIPVVILVINLIVAMIPVGFIAFLRYANTSNAPKIAYAKSGKMLYWPVDEYESTAGWFEMDGRKYVQFQDWSSKEAFFLNTTDDKRGEPVANIRNNRADTNALNETMYMLVAGSTSDKLNVSTIYPIINKNGFEFFEVNGTAGNDIFCPESKLASIKAYYRDISNYDTQNLTCEYNVYTAKKDLEESSDTPYTTIVKKVTAAPKIFEKLCQASDSGQDIKRIKIPQKYIELRKAAQPGTPIFGYDERELSAYSKDEMAYRHVCLVLLDGQVYLEQESGNGYIDGCPLSDEMNRYIIDTVFAE